MGWHPDQPPKPGDAGPMPGDLAGPVPAGRRFGLRHLMILIIGFAAVFLLARNYAASMNATDGVLLALGSAALFAAMGAWIVASFEGMAIWGWGLVVIAYMIGTFAIFSVFAILSWPILIGVIISIAARKRATEQDALAGVMAIAAGRGMPLSPGVAAFAEQSSGASRRWARALTTLLDQGWPVAEAVEALPNTVSRPAAVLIRVGSEVGALGPALRTAVELRGVRLPILRVVGGRLAYLAWLGAIGQSVVAFLLYFITPKLEAIFKDFGIALPETTTFVLRAGHFLGTYSLVILLAELLIGAFLISEITGRGPGIGSPIARLSRRRHAALILRALALAVDAGQPLEPTLATLAGTYPSRPIRKRLAAANRDMAGGEPWTDALRDRGLITGSEAGVLAAAGRAGNLGWALREMATIGERRWAQRIQAWTQVAFFFALLGAGGVVLLIALAYFFPLIQLISRMGG
ncbi:type II secretion system F family protein [Tundrisphaera sp. TA3]|uniref:type II secretion system F family protein n=1 Tax=Tundrisphaera sp. TA3 TaxID=3435775 RepID=UPI003EBA57B7